MAFNIYETNSEDHVRQIHLDENGNIKSVAWCVGSDGAKEYATQDDAERDVDQLREWAEDKDNGKEFEIIDPDGNSVEY